MLAALMHGVNDVRLTEIEKPTINSYEILVKVKSIGICGTDLRIIKNGIDGVSENSPRVLGHEISGIIEEVGSHITKYKPGMRIAIAPNMGCGSCPNCFRGNHHLCVQYFALGVHIDGGFAEYVKVPEQAVRFGNIFEIPEHISFEEAAIIEPLSCVYNGLQKCKVEPGDDVLIIGAGPIGVMMAKLAKLAGASNVMIANRSLERLEICKEIDDTFITMDSVHMKEDIMRITGGKGADVIFTANSSPEAQILAVELAAIDGRINFFGGLAKNDQLVSLNTNDIHYKQLIVTGTTKANNDHFGKTLKFISSGVIDVKKLISARFKLSEFEEALTFAQRSKGIKTVIVFD
jgi:L-iditol 2-dehydrogenase